MKIKQRKTHKKKRLIKPLILIGTFLTILGVVGCRSNVSTNDEGDKGREYLLQLEQLDLGAVEAKIDEHHKKVDSEAIESGDSEAIESGDFRSMYSDTVFMGDSITENLSFNEIVDEYNVIAYMGDTVRKAMDHIPTLEGIQPQNLILLYGMNDVILFEETAEWNSIERFKEDYKALIQEIKNRLPNTKIYVQSPLPVTYKATETNPRLTNENLTRFREAVMQICGEIGVTYVDISHLAREDSGLHEVDGIHLKREFYDKWLGYLRGFMNK